MTLWEGHGRRLADSILTREGINWYELPYDRAIIPIPIIEKDSECFEILVQESKKIKASLQPATRGVISAILYRLQGHYWRPEFTQSAALAVADDYIRLLSEYSEDDFKAAYDIWLLSSNKFFPKVGELKEVLDSCRLKKTWKLRKVEKLIEKAQ